MINADSVKARLKNLAERDNTTMQDRLTMYALERTLYRISISNYREYFTLKGGIFLYALFDKCFSRATVDIDFLALHISNSIEKMREVFTEIFSIYCDDAIKYDIKTLSIASITELKEYHGINIYITAYLDRTRIPVSIDIGFDDVIYPRRVEMTFPTLLDMQEPIIYAYSIYSVIAEKFEAFVSLGLINSRYKDFYDIYVLAKRYDLDGNSLQQAVVETFKHRHTSYDDIVAFDDDFTSDSIRRKRWDAFAKKKKMTEDIRFDEVMKVLRCLLKPIADAIIERRAFDMQWDCDDRKWM